MRKLILINALVWAGLLLLSAYLFKDHPNWKYLFMALILGFTTINSLLAVKVKRNQKVCIRVKNDK